MARAERAFGDGQRLTEERIQARKDVLEKEEAVHSRERLHTADVQAIAAERRKLTAAQAIESVQKAVGEAPVVLSAVTLAEIGHGIYRANTPEMRQRRRTFLDDLNTTLSALLGSTYINDFNRFGRVYKVYAQAEPEFRANIGSLSLFFVRSRTTGAPGAGAASSSTVAGP